MGTSDLNLLTIKTTSSILQVSEQKVRGMAQAGILELVHVGKRGPRITERSVRTLINKQIPNEIPANTEPRERSSLSLVEPEKKKGNG
jgi:hypothetical protein